MCKLPFLSMISSSPFQDDRCANSFPVLVMVGYTVRRMNDIAESSEEKDRSLDSVAVNGQFVGSKHTGFVRA